MRRIVRSASNGKMMSAGASEPDLPARDALSAATPSDAKGRPCKPQFPTSGCKGVTAIFTGREGRIPDRRILDGQRENAPHPGKVRASAVAIARTRAVANHKPSELIVTCNFDARCDIHASHCFTSNQMRRTAAAAVDHIGREQAILVAATAQPPVQRPFHGSLPATHGIARAPGTAAGGVARRVYSRTFIVSTRSGRSQADPLRDRCALKPAEPNCSTSSFMENARPSCSF